MDFIPSQFILDFIAEKIEIRNIPQKELHKKFESLNYPKFDMNSTKAGILNFGLEDFYFSQSVISEDNSAVFEVKINPLVSLIWTGAFVVVVGAIISVLPVYKKNDKVKVK